jgi:guanylate kinase
MNEADKMEYPGNLYVVAAASGTGKSSLVKAWREADPQLELSVSHTTRAPRGQEVDGREYHFVSQDEFARMIAADAFVEWAQVHGNRYGTSRQEIENRIAAGADIVLEIDFQGALQIKRQFPGAVLIFVLPPSWPELRARLQRRNEDSEETIALRMKNAAEEVAQVDRFDFVIINDLFERALSDLKTIAQAQRLKVAVQRRLRADTFRALDIL